MSVSLKPLDEIVLLQRGHDLPITSATGGLYPVVGSSGIIAYHDSYTCKAPCITIGRSGSGVGKVRYTNQDSWAHNTTLYVKDAKNNDPTYLYYLLSNIELKAYSGGSAVPTLNRNHLANIMVQYENNINKQKEIGQALLLFDIKIDKIQQHVLSLYEILNSIYKEWFSILKSSNAIAGLDKAILKGWQQSNVFDSVTEVREKNKENNDYPVFSVVKEGEFKLSDDVFTKQVYSKSTANYKIVKKNQVGYNPARANIGSIAMLKDYKIGLVSPIYVVFEMKESITPTFFYYYMKQPMFLEMIKQHAIGTTRQNFPFEAFKMFPLVVPPMELQLKFEEIAKPIEQKIALLKQENEVLAETRDTLLPKLMSGELPVEVGGK